LFVQPFLGVSRPDVPPDLTWQRRCGELVLARLVEVLDSAVERHHERVEDRIELSSHFGCRLFWENAAQQGAHPWPRGLGQLG